MRQARSETVPKIDLDNERAFRAALVRGQSGRIHDLEEHYEKLILDVSGLRVVKDESNRKWVVFAEVSFVQAMMENKRVLGGLALAIAHDIKSRMEGGKGGKS